ncbi:MAG: YciI family protein [Dongiaceae bacterium]
MKYLCLIYNDDKRLDAMSERESQAFIDEHLDYDEALKRSGHFIASEALEPGEAATIVRVRNGRLSTTDGPFAETKEQLGGFYLVEARDLNEAIQIAGKIPSARTGSIEVRPVCELTHS